VNLFTNALMPVDVSNALGKNVGIAVANPSGAIATLTLTLRKSDGTQFSTATLTIPTRRQISKLLTELFPVPAPGTFSTTVAVPSEFTGTMTMTSTVPVSLIGLKFRGETFSLIPLTDFSGATNLVPAISSGVGGLGAVILPQFVLRGGWSTEIEIVNLTATSITVRLDLFTPDGNPLSVKLNSVTSSSFTNLVVPASGSLTIAPSL